MTVWERIRAWLKGEAEEAKSDEDVYAQFFSWKGAGFHFLGGMGGVTFPPSSPSGYANAHDLVVAVRDAVARGAIGQQLLDDLAPTADVIIAEAERCYDAHSGPNSFRHAWKMVTSAVNDSKGNAAQLLEEACVYYTQCANEFFARGLCTDAWRERLRRRGGAPCA